MSHIPEVHGESRAPQEMADYNAQSPHEVDGDGEKLKAGAVVAPLVMEKSELDSKTEAVKIDEEAKHSGSPTFELPDNQVHGSTKPHEDRSELSSSPVSPLTQLHDTPSSQAATLAASSTSSTPIQSKEVPSPIAEEGNTTVADEGDSNSKDNRTRAEKEQERIELEHRKKKIAAEKEHLRRMRELEEEESNIDHRLRSL
jgi:hypothetical protein